MARARWPKGSYMLIISGRRLRRKRMEKLSANGKPWTLRKLAIRAGKPQSYTFIGRLENEKVLTCSTEFAEALAEALGCDTDYLFEPKVPKSVKQDAPFRHARRGRRAA